MATTMSVLNPPIGTLMPVEGNSGIRVDHAAGLVFVGGQISADSTGRVIGEGNLARQLEIVFDNIGRVLRDGGATWRDVVRMDVYYVPGDSAEEFWDNLKSIADRHFTVSAPVWTGVQVPGLAYPGLLVEIDAIAVLRDS